MNDRQKLLIETARNLVGGFSLSREDFSAATVGCAILSAKGNIYTGICVHLSCGIGFCAEHAAVAEMLKARETTIDTVVASAEDTILTPCGRCRELMVQVDRQNLNCNIVMPDKSVKKLGVLLPEHWISN